MIKLNDPVRGPTYWKEATKEEYDAWLAGEQDDLNEALAELQRQELPATRAGDKEGNSMGGNAHSTEAVVETDDTKVTVSSPDDSGDDTSSTEDQSPDEASTDDQSPSDDSTDSEE